MENHDSSNASDQGWFVCRHRQENFFKYMREEFAIDVLVDYGTEPADPDRDVLNPQREKVDAELKKAKVEVIKLSVETERVTDLLKMIAQRGSAATKKDGPRRS